MRRNFQIYAATLLALAGCSSSSPSDGDVKEVVQSMLGGCPNFSLEKFKKVNGVAAGEGRYAEEVVFTVKVAPVPGAKELLEKARADSAAFNERLAAAMNARNQAEATDREYDTRIEQARQSKNGALESSLTTEKMNFRAQKIKLVDEADMLSMQRRRIDSETSPVLEKFLRDCPNVHPMIQVYESNNPDQFTTTFTKDFAGTLPLVKTDNGWRGAF
jgi:predicted  nucleic acid-binding Zn-ribbon protein